MQLTQLATNVLAGTLISAIFTAVALSHGLDLRFPLIKRQELIPTRQCRSGEPCSVLRIQIEEHVALVHGELQEMVGSLCPTTPPVRVPSPWEQEHGNVNVPSCGRLVESRLEAYYGNLNMLLVEAWLGKIVPAVQALEQAATAKAALLSLPADGVMGGAIYVQQLRLAPPPAG